MSHSSGSTRAPGHRHPHHSRVDGEDSSRGQGRGKRGEGEDDEDEDVLGLAGKYRQLYGRVCKVALDDP